MSLPSFDTVEVGTELPAREVPLTRLDLIRYAGASGDFNVIHWNERIARAVGLPGVIAHGMLTMAQAARLVTDWLGDPAALLEVKVRFTRPVPVPDDDTGAVLSLSASVAEKLDDRCVRIAVNAALGEQAVLGRAEAVARLA